MDTIEELWDGNLAPGEHCGVGDPEIENLNNLMEWNREQLVQVLGPQQKALLEKYTDCMDEFTLRMTACAFREGYCLGSRLMAEALR